MPKQPLFVLTDELQRALDSLPSVETRSCLDPLRTFILRWRREGRSYRKIQQILENECKVKVHNETLRRFVKRRSKPRKPKPEPDQLELAVAEAPADRPPEAFTPGAKRLTPEERQAQVEYIRSLNQPTPQSKPEKPRWHFDVDKPRTLQKP